MNDCLDFYYECIRNNKSELIEKKLHELLKKYKKDERKYIRELTTLYVLICHTRDILCGKGEYMLAYMQLYVWYQYYPKLARRAFEFFVYIDKNNHPYGSWKDVKYLCQYIYERTGNSCHPFIFEVCEIMTEQIKKDIVNVDKGEVISLAGKWCPREKKKYDWVFNIIAEMYSREIMVTAKTWSQGQRAFKKIKMILRKIISRLNFIVATAQINMCNNDWENIAFVSSRTWYKNRRALMKHIPNTTLKYTARHLEMNEIIKASKDEKMNELWEVSRVWNKPLGNVLAMINLSGKLEEENREGFNAGIGLGIRISELSLCFKHRLMTFSSTGNWVNLEKCETLRDKVEKIKKSREGMGMNYISCLMKIIEGMTMKGIDPRQSLNMTIILFTYGMGSTKEIMEKIVNLYSLYSRQKRIAWKLPHIVFWNLGSTKMDLQINGKITLISGYKESLLKKFAMTNGINNKENMMIKVIKGRRYERVRREIRTYFS